MDMVSAVILTKNEEKNIKSCMAGLSFCGEVIVVDDASTDKTVKIAKKLGARVFCRKLQGDFSKQRNFGLSKSSGKWVLFVDADEIVSKRLAKEVEEKTLSDKKDINGYYLKRLDHFLGKKLRFGETSQVKLLRLAKKDSGGWVRKVHEVWEMEGRVGELINPLIHYPHKTLKKFVHSMNKHSSLHATANLEEGKRSNLIKILFWPPLKFINNFIFKLGFLDGIHGFLVAMMMSFHSYLSWSKLWLTQRKTS